MPTRRAITVVALAALALPAAPAAAKGLVGLSVCGAQGCVARDGLVRPARAGNGDALLDASATVADPGRAPFVRLKVHIGDPQTGRAFGTTTLIYLPREGLVRNEEGVWLRPSPAAATAYKRAARGVPAFPGSALKPHVPSPVRVDETVPPPPAPAPDSAPARPGGGDGVPAGILAALAAAAGLAAAGGARHARRRRGRPATG
jgi:hypothetical protein